MTRAFGAISCFRTEMLSDDRTTLALYDHLASFATLDLQSSPTPHLLTNSLPTPAGRLLPVVVPYFQCVVVQPSTSKTDRRSFGCKSCGPVVISKALYVFYKRDQSDC